MSEDKLESRKIYAEALQMWGKESQICMAIEEMAELIQAINKYYRNKVTLESVAEEVADVEITLEQLKEIFSISEQVSKHKKEKLNRLKTRIYTASFENAVKSSKRFLKIIGDDECDF